MYCRFRDCFCCIHSIGPSLVIGLTAKSDGGRLPGVPPVVFPLATFSLKTLAFLIVLALPPFVFPPLLLFFPFPVPFLRFFPRFFLLIYTRLSFGFRLILRNGIGSFRRWMGA